ncbi:Rz1 family lipoprotein [Escherichia coli]|uniref:Rz1 family lipoprotein n=3 Tax=Escherichia coli TaxID=562 RepID=A0A8S7PL53_ECOLX|nr:MULTISPECIES: Rz1 family lipoprotein [Escherichia]EHQ5529477.1 Rz1 family lipoprotein [Escherichia coli O2]EHY2112099.1 Rz1 family lipoprotein [Escherichia coli O157]EKH5947721.1 Rz1 family lipoprotein [Escherichia coli O103]EKH6043120.1 Rz1 family lipoprotein [Escherichia coli O136]HDQ6569796.1 Rz1 family lipoprotein [Escherichia coli Ou:H7]HDQ6728307.1 Rz1 family lipoprotein [Escherichia coli O11:H5]
MRELKMKLCVLMLPLVVSACGSTPPVQAPCVKPPPPPAWAMMPASNSLQLLDETFSVSETESSATRQH